MPSKKKREMRKLKLYGEYWIAGGMTRVEVIADPDAQKPLCKIMDIEGFSKYEVNGEYRFNRRQLWEKPRLNMTSMKWMGGAYCYHMTCGNVLTQDEAESNYCLKCENDMEDREDAMGEIDLINMQKLTHTKAKFIFAAAKLKGEKVYSMWHFFHGEKKEVSLPVKVECPKCQAEHSFHRRRNDQHPKQDWVKCENCRFEIRNHALDLMFKKVP